MWDDEHLWFAEICSPQTLENIRCGSLVEVNVVDPFVRKGYRFKGPAVIYGPGTDQFADGIERRRTAGSKLLHRVNAVVVIEVQQASALISPVYDDGTVTEAEIVAANQARFAKLHKHAAR